MESSPQEVTPFTVRDEILDYFKLDRVGVVFALFGFFLSLTPSLLPRDWLFQGVVSGLSAATSGLAGVLLHWLWNALLLTERLQPVDRWRQQVFVRRWRNFVERRTGQRITPRSWVIRIEASIILVILAIEIAWVAYAVRWQQELAALMGAKSYSTLEFLLVVPVSFTLWMVLLFLGRGFLWVVDKISDTPRVSGFVPAKARHIVVFIGLITLMGVVLSIVVPGSIVRITEGIFSLRNEEIRADLQRPDVAERSGGPGSPLAWEDLGAYGTRFVSLGLDKAELEELTGTPAVEPIRVYAGLPHGEDNRQRALTVVEELKRTHAEEREAVMVAPATGTGWVNPTAAQAFELIHNGNTAIASAQYSYIPSAVQFIASQEEVRDYGRELIGAVTEWHQSLPENTRPKLYLYGESLGTIAGEGAFSGLRDIAHAVDGVLWVGPPNSHRIKQEITLRRDPGSTEISPRYSDGMMVRFAQNSEEIYSWTEPDSDLPASDWGSHRVLFLQHPSDPVAWWNPSLAAMRPAWLSEAAGFDRSTAMRWYPWVTFWQVSMDLPVAANVPNGHGHNYGNSVLHGLLAINVGSTSAAESQYQRSRGAELEKLLDQAMVSQGPEKEVGVDDSVFRPAEDRSE